ncbi:hypothetical protein R5R35_013735 [Gryllus longicercus]|uniref:Sex-determining region Y protein n=1 Tax=Gryllus longicercus TaxID=2509291 RepID=A0AAN9VUB6_9ORTH
MDVFVADTDDSQGAEDRESLQFAQNSLQQRPKIPRPPNAFMLFANEWRKKLAMQYPSESNKDISVRLGGMWKSLEKDSKEQYFALARQVDAEHKRKYPGE